MITLGILIGRTRFKCGSPDDATLGNQFVADQIGEVLDEMVTEMNLTSVPWFAPRFELEVSANEDLYPIPVKDFGKLLFVHTFKQDDPTFSTTVVDVVAEPMLYTYLQGGDPGVVQTGFSAQGMATVNKDGKMYIRVAPIPGTSATYMCIYEPDRVQPNGLQAPVQRMQQFTNYLTDRAAYKLLPYAGMDSDRYTQIQATLGAEIQRGELRFRRWRRSDHQSNASRSIPYGANRWPNRRFF